MLAASKWFKQVAQSKPKSCVSRIDHKLCSNSQIRRLIREQANCKRTSWAYKHVDGCLLTSSQSLRKRRHYPHTNFLTSILVGVSWVLPFFATVSTSLGDYQSVASQASPFEEELTDELLNKIFSAIENASKSTREICTTYIEKLCKAGNLLAVAKLLQFLHDKHIFLTTNAYNLLLGAAGEGNNIGLLFQVFKDLLVSNESVNSTSYLNFAKAFAHTNDAVLLL
ncbi:hypothetical protein U1Q18_004499 [Sarracenia purpurea var. burkii]